MASDVTDHTTIYAGLPSIFENNSSSYNTIVTDVNIEKSYQPMFSSFLFADSDPLNRAAFVVSSSSSIDIETTQERLMDNCISNENDNDNGNNILSSIQTTSSPIPFTNIDDIDEDDFDGIPIRHASMTVQKELNEFIDHIENSQHDSDDDIEDDTFLNGFNDEQHEITTQIPSLFKDIPDIDDPNQPEDDDEDEEERNRIPFDHMDMSDQSDSIRSSSPDSLLSSSHLQDEQDDIDIDQEVEQWNDEHILDTTISNTNHSINKKQSSLNLQIHPFDQVNFIDTSRSNSRCSNVSSQLSIGYADQAHQFISDNELLASSDSDDDDNDNDNDNIINFDCDTFNYNDENEDDICLQVNLDNHRSFSPFNKSDSSRSSLLLSPIPDETPINDIDEDNIQSKDLQIAPIAALDDDDDLEEFTSDQPILSHRTSNIKNIFQLKIEQQNDIIHDIINMRHLFNENNHDDEFIAIMHNPTIFEQILYNNMPKKSELAMQTNSVTTSTFRPPTQLSIDNKIKKESFEHHQNIHQTSSLLESNKNEKIFDSSILTRKTSTPPPTTTTNSCSFPDVNHLHKEEKENDVSINVDNTNDILQKKQTKEQQLQTNTTEQVKNNKKYYSMLDTDNESDDNDDDLELLKTLSQIHGIINPTETTQGEFQTSSYSRDIISSDLSYGNDRELFNEKKSVKKHIIPPSPFIINTIKQFDEEEEEKNEKKNIIFYKNHNNVDGGDKQKEKYERREEEEEEKKPTTTFFSLTSSTSPILFNDDSHSSVVIIDSNTSTSLSNVLLLPLNNKNQSTETLNQLITDDLQISKTKINMNNLPKDELSQQTTTTNLFDPFGPTATTTNMFDDILNDSNPQSNSNSIQPLANYNFDDLWNQSISDINKSSNNNIDPNTFAWDAFLNTNTEQTNTNLTWENLFGKEKEEEEEKTDLKEYLNWLFNHLNDSKSIITFTSTQNLESIVKDIQMSTLPFEPIPSPPLHIDHTVANPLINAIHHDLFPIDELEQPNIIQEQQSMILYEVDEAAEEEEQQQQPNKFFSFDDEVKPIIDKLVSDTLQLALTELNQPYQQVEHFVDQILTQAIYEVYHEDKILLDTKINDDPISIENLASIISWHDQTKASNKQLPDPFDQKFDSVWSSHFQTPGDLINENLFENEQLNTSDPWLMTTTTTTTESNKDLDPMILFSQTFDDSDLFSSSNNKTQEIDNTKTTSTILNEYLPSTILTNTTNNLMKYTITAPVIDDSGDDSLTLDDYFVSHKNKSSTEIDRKADEQSNEPKDMPLKEEKEIEINEQENFFTNNAYSSPLKVFTNDQSLNSSEIDSKFTNITSQIDEESSQTDINGQWTSIEKPIETTKSSGIGDDEPWELEDNGEEKMTPIPTTTRLTSPFNDEEYSPVGKVNLHNNLFSDSFNPNNETEQILTKTVRFDDNIQNIRVPTPIQENISSSSDEIEIDDITLINDRMETSYVNVDETDLNTERPYESIELTPQIENEDFSQSNISNDINIPLQPTLNSLSNTETEYKINLRSEPEITTTTTTNTQLIQSNESGILIVTSICC